MSICAERSRRLPDFRGRFGAAVTGRYAGAVGSRTDARCPIGWCRVRAAVQIGCGTCDRARRTRPHLVREAFRMGSVVKKRRKRMAKKKHRKLLRKTRV